jgi:hypothetical protein
VTVASSQASWSRSSYTFRASFYEVDNLTAPLSGWPYTPLKFVVFRAPVHPLLRSWLAGVPHAAAANVAGLTG